MIRFSALIAIGSTAALLLVPVPARAASGKVVDEQGKPLSGAKACYMLGSTEALCVDADAQGSWSLPESRVSSVRVSAKGYMPKLVPAGENNATVVLERAASLKVRLVDAATGAPIAHGTVWLTYASGSRKGPFPINAAGVEIATLPVGEATPSATSDGYTELKGKTLELEAGARAEIVLELRRKEPAPAGR